jgi:hypothetical protein
MSQQISLNKTTKINRSVKFLSVLLVILCAAVSAKAAGELIRHLTLCFKKSAVRAESLPFSRTGKFW